MLVLLTDLLAPDLVKIPLVANDKDAVLRELVELVERVEPGVPSDEVLRAVREREQKLSTGIGNGVAIPHGKAAGLDRLRLAAGVAHDGIEFEALDGQPVRLFFLLVGPESAAGEHVKALSRIARLLQRDTFRTRLAAAAHPEEFYALLTEAEAT